MRIQQDATCGLEGRMPLAMRKRHKAPESEQGRNRACTHVQQLRGQPLPVSAAHIPLLSKYGGKAGERTGRAPLQRDRTPACSRLRLLRAASLAPVFL